MNTQQKDASEDVFHHIKTLKPDASCQLQAKFVSTRDDVLKKFSTDYAEATKSLDKIFSSLDDVALNTDKTYQLIKAWHNGERLFSTTSLVAYAISKFDPDNKLDKKHKDALFVAGVLADIRNDLPYHNTLHFRKVVLHIIRMIVAHNHIFDGTANILGLDAITKLVIGACIHDLGHEGSGNIIDRKYHMAMTEKRAFDLAQPYLKSAGLDDDMLSDIRIMIMTTDVSPFGDPISPVNQMRSAYEYHFGMESDDEELDISEELAVLAENAKLCLLCVMLHEADIMNSAGVHYDILRMESVAVSKEMGEDRAYPEDTLLFLDKTCGNGMLSDSAQFLADENLRNIKAKVLEDYKNGNQSYS